MLDRLHVVDPGDARQLGLEMRDGPQGWIVRGEKPEGPLQEREQLRFIVIRLRAKLDQFDEIRGRLHARVTLADSGERISQRHFAQRMQIGFPAARDLDFRFEE